MAGKNFGRTSEGLQAFSYELTNRKGMKVILTDYGATVVSVLVPDREGKLRDVVLGHDDVSGYEHNGCCFGAAVGPNANRIANASFAIDGVTYRLEPNDNKNNLHSGSRGVEWKVWEVKEQTGNAITFRCTNQNLEQGFPGNSEMTAAYRLTDDNALEICYRAVSDQKTVFNMTNHSYFNLNGHDSGDIYDHMLLIHASAFTPLRNDSVPDGRILSVANTPFDFRAPKPIGRDIGLQDEQLIFGSGYDHNWILDRKEHESGHGAESGHEAENGPGTGSEPEPALAAWAEESGILMEVLTDRPGIQIYTANFVIDEPGKKGAIYQRRSAFAAETQGFPNAVNEPAFPSVIYNAGEVYEAKTIFRFSVLKQ